MIIEQVNASNYNSWIQPTLTFFDMTLEDIITNLERWFNVPIGTDASVDRTICLSFHVRHAASHLAHHGTAIHARRRVGHVPHRTNHQIKIT